MGLVRRFFFDDGKSRVRWHISTDATTLLVHSGKIGGKLRETSKAFSDNTELRKEVKRLIEAKLKKGYVEIKTNPIEVTRAKSVKDASEADIKSLEKSLKVKLPIEYQKFLKSNNGGRPNPDFVKLPGVKGFDNIGVGVFFCLDPAKPRHEELTFELSSPSNPLPGGHLPIAHSSDYFSICLREKSFGCVYWWNHDNGSESDRFSLSEGFLLAGSFDEFMTRIEHSVDSDDKDSESSSETSASPIAASTRMDSRADIKRLMSLMRAEHTPAMVKEIVSVARTLDLRSVKDGSWPFKNISDASLLKSLLEAGLNPEIVDTDNHSLLWLCAGDVDCINLLLEKGVAVDRRSGSEKETALMRALFGQDIPSVKRLLEAGANPTVKLRWYISDRLKRNKELTDLLEKARTRWRSKRS